MKQQKVKLIPILIFIMIILATAPAGFANSAEPPSILIVVPNAPEGMELALDRGDRSDPSNRQDQWLETSFRFYSHGLNTQQPYHLLMTIDGETTRIPIENLESRYNNLYTLDWKSKTLTPGRSPFRSALYVALRVIFTLLIEGAVFYAFGFRDKRSWMIFLLINLFTQGALNIWLNSMFPSNGYIIFALVIGEFFVFLAELIGFLALITEQKRLKTAGYVIIANLASLVLGGYLITLLPL